MPCELKTAHGGLGLVQGRRPTTAPTSSSKQVGSLEERQDRAREKQGRMERVGLAREALHLRHRTVATCGAAADEKNC